MRGELLRTAYNTKNVPVFNTDKGGAIADFVGSYNVRENKGLPVSQLDLFDFNNQQFRTKW